MVFVFNHFNQKKLLKFNVFLLDINQKSKSQTTPLETTYPAGIQILGTCVDYDISLLNVSLVML